MNKNILVSLSVVVAVAAIAVGGTIAYFSDTETSTGNTLTAGVIDIVVDGQNPWTRTFSDELKDMKPSDTKYIEFTVRNLEASNPVKVWKHIDITERGGGVMTEPECEAEKGGWTAAGCVGNTPRDNLDPYIIYDLYVNGEPIIKETQYVRLDNVSSAWIYLGQLNPDQEMKVKQSYHLSSWPGAPESEVGNWAQGDVLKFNIDLYAEQLGGPGPKGAQAMVTLENKDPVTWNPIFADDIGGTLTYNTSGSTFNYSFTGKVLTGGQSHCLIYYADPWPGDGKTHNTGKVIACQDSQSDGTLNLSGNVELNTDLPNSDDQNYPGGAKLWIVPKSDYDIVNENMTAWNTTKYLFEMQFITYDDTGI